ncbi:MAG TPA: patatin-like phospholipase family protein [Opitutaceae bacterium]|nr:patatin-like phospholipase family protein [Opitutaceae bacterium]
MKPKRILALDGGGICGVFSLKVLQRIEQLFRERYPAKPGEPEVKLRDVFDFFAGTSTGAIIATFLAWGKTVDEVLELYAGRGAEMFAPAPWYERFWKAKFRAETITEFFRTNFVEDDEKPTPALLGTGRLRTKDGTLKYLMAVMRDASTGSAWPVTNNPQAMYNDRSRPDCNLNIPLWQLLRASTAAPTYFPPEEIKLGDQTHIFVDGGITPYNNPALIAALTATLPCYRIGWPTGRDRLQVVSVGACSTRTRLKKDKARQVHKLDFLQFIAPAFLGTVAMEQDLLCRVLGDCVFGAALDSELGPLPGTDDGLLARAEKKFTYVRYDKHFTSAEVAAIEQATGQRFDLDNLKLVGPLQEIGEAYAREYVKPEHLFPPGID